MTFREITRESNYLITRPLISSNKSSKLYIDPSFFPKQSQPAYSCPPVSPLSPLHQKLTIPPAQKQDKLHPKADRSYTHYVDEGMWQTRISFMKDPSPSVAIVRSRAAATHSYESLDALCEAELQRRYPGYRVIDGVKAWFKNSFSNVTRWVMGKEQFYQELTPKEVNKYKKQIAFSGCNRDDLVAEPKIDSPALRQSLGITSDAVLKSEHIFAKNSPMNGLSFRREEETVLLDQGIACSADRKVENTGNLRVVKDASGNSVAYTGRVDSDHKAEEQAAFIFFNELKSGMKGITQTVSVDGSIVYEMDYLLNCLLSAPWIWGEESAIATFPEREYIHKQIQALNHLRERGVHTLTDPNDPSKTYQVKFNPILVSDSFNIFVRLQKVLPPFFTGEGRAAEITEEGLTGLEKVAARKIGQLQREKKYEVLAQVQGHLKKLHDLEDDTSMEPEDRILAKILYRDHLCKLLGLPIVFHCKSSTDRTSITIALSQTLGQWIAMKQPLPSDLSILLKDWRFKELFVANWMAGHQITRHARGGEGTVAGETLNQKNLGLSLSRGMAQNPMIAKLVPERYLTDYSFFERGGRKVLPNCLKVLAIIVLSIILVPFGLLRLLTAPVMGHRITRWDVLFPLMPFVTLKNLPGLFPDKVLNEKSPQVGGRKLIAGGKNAKGSDDNH